MPVRHGWAGADRIACPASVRRLRAGIHFLLTHETDRIPHQPLMCAKYGSCWPKKARLPVRAGKRVGDDTTVTASNPLGKVPCLVMEGGEPVFDSRVIVEYLDTLSPVGKLIPASGARTRGGADLGSPGRRPAMDAAMLARMEATWVHRTDEQRSQAWIDRQMGKVNPALKAISQGLGDKPYCSGIHLSLSDIAVGCALGWLEFRYPELAWRTDTPTWAS